MAKECPECGKPVDPKAPACEECGAELAKKAPAGPRKPLPDGAKYAIIVGSIVAIIIVLALLAGGMGKDWTCAQCKGKGQTVCKNCKGGDVAPKCDNCKGTGRDPQNYSTCQTCGGKGTVAQCPKCKGNPRQKCKSCDGTGKLPD